MSVFIYHLHLCAVHALLFWHCFLREELKSVQQNFHWRTMKGIEHLKAISNSDLVISGITNSSVVLVLCISQSKVNYNL